MTLQQMFRNTYAKSLPAAPERIQVVMAKAYMTGWMDATDQLECPSELRDEIIKVSVELSFCIYELPESWK